MTQFMHLICPSCSQVNRIPADGPAARAKCGRCHERMFQGTPFSVDEALFLRHLATDECPLLVDFWASWCGPCLAMAPAFSEAAGALEPEVRLLKLNADEARRASQRFGIRSIPTLLVFRAGRVVARSSGAMTRDQIVAWTRQHLAATAMA